MKKALIFSSMLCLSAITTLGQVADDNDAGDRFKKGEWDLSPFLTYVDKVGDDWGLGLAATYFVTDKIGVGAVTYWTDFGGTFFDNLGGEAYFRLPLFKVIAPYGVGSIGYQFDSDEWFETLGVGADFRPFEKISAFSDISYRFNNKTRDGALFRLGVRFSF